MAGEQKKSMKAIVELALSAQLPTGEDIDIHVRAARGATFQELRPALLSCLGIDTQSDVTLRIGRECLDGDWIVGDSPIRNGAHISTATSVDTTSPGATHYVAIVGGRNAGNRVPLSTARFSVGRAPECDFILDDLGSSSRHLEIGISPRGVDIRDLDPTNPTCVAGHRLSRHGSRIAQGEILTLGNTQLAVLAIDSQAPSANGDVQASLAPSGGAPSDSLRIELPGSRRTRYLAYRSIGLASMVGVSAAMATSMPNAATAVLVLISPFASIAMMAGSSARMASTGRRPSRRRLRKTVENLLTAEATVLRARYPGAIDLLNIADMPDRTLRRTSDADFLQLRVGTGDISSTGKGVRDGVEEPLGVLSSTPVAVDLQGTSIALVGSQDFTYALARFLLTQIVVLHHPSDVQVLLLLSPPTIAHWQWTRWLPHVHALYDDQEKAAAASDLCQRLEAADVLCTDTPTNAGRHPHIVVVIDDDSTTSYRLILDRLACEGAAHGITTLLLRRSDQSFGSYATAVVSLDDIYCQINKEGQDPVHLLADLAGAQWADQVARAIAANATDPCATLTPSQVRLTDLLGSPTCTRDILDRWAEQDGLSTIIGLGQRAPITVDLIRDGPHALVAGTTGSGKSGFLQALVVGLASSMSPSVLNFVLIDYKGGAAFGRCQDLPHTTGMVTDLDPYLTMRALTSLQSEIRRRERAFQRYQAQSFDDYNRHREPNSEEFARLVIIVDEFATLSDELPTFVDGLVAVARSGRSLGIHLILATQRPRGVISEQIRANVSMRVALRVTDPVDSVDVIGCDLASRIDPRSPGRGFIERAGVVEQVQTGSLGLAARTAASLPDVRRLKPWPRSRGEPEPNALGTEPTDLQQMVELIGDAARVDNCRPPRRPWLAPLPASLSLTELVQMDETPAGTDLRAGHSIQVGIGMQDLPDEQMQAALNVNLDGEAWLITGASGSGRTTALRTIALAASHALDPGRLALYGVDFAGGALHALAGMAHCAGILNSADFDASAHMIDRLLHEVRRRRNHHATAPLRDEHQRPRTNLECRVVVLIDGWDELSQSSDRFDGGRTAAQLLALATEGTAVGFSTVVAGGRATLSSRVTGAIANRLILPLADRNDYALLGVPEQLIPTARQRGRAVVLPPRVLAQIAHPEPIRCADSPRTDQPGLAGSSNVGAVNIEASAATAAGTFSSLPTRTTLNQVIRARRLRPVTRACGSTPSRLPGWVEFGFGGNNATPLGCNLLDTPRMVAVVGPTGSGRTTALKIMLAQLHDTCDLLVVAATNGPLRSMADEYAIRCWPPSELIHGLTTYQDKATVALLDDLTVIARNQLDDVLIDLQNAVDSPTSVVVTGRAEDFRSHYGLAKLARQSKTGLLLSTAEHEGELFGLRLPANTGVWPPGRALLVSQESYLDAHRRRDGTVPLQLATMADSSREPSPREPAPNPPAQAS